MVACDWPDNCRERTRGAPTLRPSMSLDIDTLDALRRQHPAWRLLVADSAPLVASFLHRVFVLPNRRAIHQTELATALDDTLYSVREWRGPGAFPKPALD
jgi:hypothetical protein